MVREKKPWLYDPSAKHKADFNKELRKAVLQMGCCIPVYNNDEKIRLTLHFFMPKLMSKDVDNLVKFFMDSFQGVLYKNDQMVYELHASKHESKISKFTVELITIN